MNRRSFLDTIIKAGASCAILPPATTYVRSWVGIVIPTYQIRVFTYSHPYAYVFNPIIQQLSIRSLDIRSEIQRLLTEPNHNRYKVVEYQQIAKIGDKTRGRAGVALLNKDVTKIYPYIHALKSKYEPPIIS